MNAIRVRRNSAESIRIQPQDIQQRTLHSHIAYPCLRFRRLIGAYVGDGNHLSRSMCMVVVRRRVRVYNHHTVNDMYVSKHSNAGTSETVPAETTEPICTFSYSISRMKK